VAPGDPRLHAFSLMGPMVMAMLFREIFGGAGANPPDLQALADQHARTALRGLLMPATGAVTLVSQTHAPDDVYEDLCSQFSEGQDYYRATSTINAWNRITISFRAVHTLQGDTA
jgi:alkylhydroperoxidase family enzyme